MCRAPLSCHPQGDRLPWPTAALLIFSFDATLWVAIVNIGSYL